MEIIKYHFRTPKHLFNHSSGYDEETGRKYPVGYATVTILSYDIKKNKALIIRDNYKSEDNKIILSTKEERDLDWLISFISENNYKKMKVAYKLNKILEV